MAFFAIALTPDLKQRITESMRLWQERWPQLAWVHPEDYHLTLRFLGGLPPPRLRDFLERFEQDVPRVPPFSIECQGLGHFRKGRQGGVLWMGLAQVPEPLEKLQAALELRARALGLGPELRPYNPHVTLAHAESTDFKSILPQWTNHTIVMAGAMQVDTYHFMKRRHGAKDDGTCAIYESLSQYSMEPSFRPDFHQTVDS